MKGNRKPQWRTEIKGLCHSKDQHRISTPAIELGRIRHTKLMILHAAIVLKMVPVRSFQTVHLLFDLVVSF